MKQLGLPTVFGSKKQKRWIYLNDMCLNDFL